MNESLLLTVVHLNRSADEVGERRMPQHHQRLQPGPQLQGSGYRGHGHLWQPHGARDR